MIKHAAPEHEKSLSGLTFQIVLEWWEADAVEFRGLLNRAFAVSSDGKQAARMEAAAVASAYRVDAIAKHAWESTCE